MNINPRERERLQYVTMQSSPLHFRMRVYSVRPMSVPVRKKNETPKRLKFMKSLENNFLSSSFRVTPSPLKIQTYLYDRCKDGKQSDEFRHLHFGCSHGEIDVPDSMIRKVHQSIPAAYYLVSGVHVPTIN